jgi:hypothetical protein
MEKTKIDKNETERSRLDIHIYRHKQWEGYGANIGEVEREQVTGSWDVLKQRIPELNGI